MKWFIMLLLWFQALSSMHQFLPRAIPRFFNLLDWTIVTGPFLMKMFTQRAALSKEDDMTTWAEELEESNFRKEVQSVLKTFNLYPETIKMLKIKKEMAEGYSGSAGAFNNTLLFSPDFINNYHFYQHWALRFILPHHAKQTQESVRFTVGHEIAHIKNQDIAATMAFNATIPVVLNSTMRGLARLVRKSPSHAEHYSFLMHTKRVPLSAGKLLMAIALERYYKTYLEYRADIQAAETLGASTCRAGARIFEEKERKARRLYASLWLDLAQTTSEHINLYPFLKECAFDGHCREVVRTMVRNLYFLWQEWTPLYALRTCHPSHSDRASYLNKLADKLEQQEKER